MDHYIDIRLRPDPELVLWQVMDVVFGRLHLALVARGTGDIGVSFPEVSAGRVGGLGRVLRLHGRSDALDSLMQVAWLGSARDHVLVGGVATVPSTATHRVVRRVQVKSNVERIRRRQMRRHGYDEAQAREQVPDSVERTTGLPYVNVRSGSSGQTFRLFVEHGAPQPAAQSGSFSAYGLSNAATVPSF